MQDAKEFKISTEAVKEIENHLGRLPFNIANPIFNMLIKGLIPVFGLEPAETENDDTHAPVEFQPMEQSI